MSQFLLSAVCGHCSGNLEVITLNKRQKIPALMELMFWSRESQNSGLVLMLEPIFLIHFIILFKRAGQIASSACC